MKRVKTTRWARRTRWVWPLVVALAVFSIGFWTAAGLFHEEEGVETDPDNCPICQLERLTGSGAPSEMPAALPPPTAVVEALADRAAPAPLVECQVNARTPRGPPLPV